MKLDERSISALTIWMRKSLRRITELDPHELIKYILTILSKTFDTDEEHENYCASDLQPFLKGKASAFTRDLFVAIKDGSYLTATDDGDLEDEDYDDDVGCDGNRAWNHDDEEVEEDEEDDNRRRPRRELFADDDGAAEVGVKRVMVSDSRENSKMLRTDPKSKSLPQGVCHGFLRGNCTRGASCRFPHMLDPSGGGSFHQSYPQQQWGSQQGGYGMPMSMGMNMGFGAGAGAGAGFPMMDPQMMLMMGMDPYIMAMMDPSMIANLSSYNAGPKFYEKQQPVPAIGLNRNEYSSSAPNKSLEQVEAMSADRTTLFCSKIPSYVKEDDLIDHFSTFGDLVELIYTQREVLKALPDDTKKVYNDCLVQFMKGADALKCFHSPEPVLNNRFIILKQHPSNILDTANLPEIPKYFMHKAGAKYGKKSFGKLRLPQSEEDVKLKEDAKAMAAQKAKQQYDDLKNLREEADTLLKQKISLLQGQIDQFMSMLKKLQSGSETEAKQKLITEIEMKLLNLHGKMQGLVSQRDNPSTSVSPSPKSFAGEQAGYGGRTRAPKWRGGRGRARSGGRIGRGGSYAPMKTDTSDLGSQQVETESNEGDNSEIGNRK